MRRPDPVTVPARYVQAIARAAIDRGFAREEVAAWAGGLDARLLERPRGRVSLKRFSRLYGAAVQRLGDESAGLGAHPIPPGAVETMTRAACTTSHLGACAEVMARALNAIVQDLRVSFVQDRGTGQIVLVEPPARAPARARPDEPHLGYEVILLTTYATLAWLVGRRLPLVSVDFPGPSPRHAFELKSLFAGPLRFDCPHAALRLGADHLGLPVVRAPADIPKFLRRAPGSLIDALLTKGHLTIDVRRRLQEAFPALLTLGQVADLSALSARSLHRKLALEGASFQKIKDEMRRDIAIEALTRTHAPLKQIALDVGFTDQASFQRAFVQWTGRPPGSWRKASARRP